MKRKHILLIGSVLTAFVVTIDLMWVVPVWIRALLFFLAGFTGTYYAALSNKLDREKNVLEQVIVMEREIEKIVEMENNIQHIEQLIKNLVPCEQVLYMRDGEWIEGINDGDLSRLQSMAGAEKGLILNRTDEIKKLGINKNVKSLLFLRSGKEGQDEKLVFCINSRQEMFDRYDLYILQFLLDRIEREKIKMEMMKKQTRLGQELACILVDALEKNAPLFAGHGRRVEKIAVLLGEKLGLTEEEREVLSWAALLHDIGRCIPHEEEEGEKDKHAVYGAELFPAKGVLGEIRKAIYYHHERYDGSGLPEGLKYEKIPFISRIIAVADIYDAVVYINREGEALNHDLGRAVIKKATGTLFDPLVVAAMGEIEREVEEIYTSLVG